MRPCEVGDQDPVGGRVERRLEQRQRALALLLRAPLFGHVPEVGDDAAHGGLVQAVHRPPPRARASCRRASRTRKHVRTRSPGARRTWRRRAAPRSTSSGWIRSSASAPDPLLGPVAARARRSRRSRSGRAGRARRPPRRRRRVEQRAVALLALAQRRLGVAQHQQLPEQVEAGDQQRSGERRRRRAAARSGDGGSSLQATTMCSSGNSSTATNAITVAPAACLPVARARAPVPRLRRRSRRKRAATRPIQTKGSVHGRS